jgi:hypothetical protein
MSQLPQCPLNHSVFAFPYLESVICDHPWIGCHITFPLFAKDGFVNGVIERCLIHPRGQLMFDINWPKAVPPLHGSGYRGKIGWEVVLIDNPNYYEFTTRMFGKEIATLTELK